MSKKTVILTDKQLDEIANGVSSYLDALGTKPDMPNNFSNEISADGSAGDGETYADKETSDDFGKRHYPEYRWAIGPRTFGKGPSNIHEMSKKEWEEKYILHEENSRLANRTFNGKSYEAAKKEGQRIRNAAKKMRNGSSEQEKEQGQRTLSRMMQYCGEDFGKSSNLLSNAQNADKIIQASKPEGTKIKSAPKTGVGTTHDKNIKNGIITLPSK